MEDKMLLTYPLMMDVVSKNATMSVTMGTWGTKAGFKKAGGYEHTEIPRFFRKSCLQFAAKFHTLHFGRNTCLQKLNLFITS